MFNGTYSLMLQPYRVPSICDKYGFVAVGVAEETYLLRNVLHTRLCDDFASICNIMLHIRMCDK